MTKKKVQTLTKTKISTPVAVALVTLAVGGIALAAGMGIIKIEKSSELIKINSFKIEQTAVNESGDQKLTINAEAVISENVINKGWKIDQLSLVDKSGNKKTYNFNELKALREVSNSAPFKITSFAVKPVKKIGASDQIWILSATAVVKKDLVEGGWRVDSLLLIDGSGNKKSYSYDDLNKLGATGLSIINSNTNNPISINPVVSRKPVIKSLGLSYKQVHCVYLIRLIGENFNDANTIYLDGKTDETLKNISSTNDGKQIDFQFISPMCVVPYGGNHFFSVKLQNAKGESNEMINLFEVPETEGWALPTITRITPTASTCPATIKINGCNFSRENMVKIGSDFSNVVGPFSYDGSGCGDLTVIIPKESCNKIKTTAFLEVLSYNGWSSSGSRTAFTPKK